MFVTVCKHAPVPTLRRDQLTEDRGVPDGLATLLSCLQAFPWSFPSTTQQGTSLVSATARWLGNQGKSLTLSEPPLSRQACICLPPSWGSESVRGHGC